MKDNTEKFTRKVMKRSGKLVNYEPYKIARAIESANNEELREDKKLSDTQIDDIVDIVSSIVYRTKRELSVEEIQDLVQEEIAKRSYSVFLLFHDYRFEHQQIRDISGLDEKIQGIVEVIKREDGSIGVQNEEVKRENANKDTTIASVQRDYIAGEWNRYYTNEHLLPADIRQAHAEGIIHFHDTDFFAMHITNCCLVNLEDMLTNGTAISGTKIDPPKSFLTAATITSQIVSQVSSSQYGGQTWTLSHLVPFVDISRKKIRDRKLKKFKDLGIDIGKKKLDKLVEEELIEELESGCQTIQYQLITIQTTNGQAPFVTEFMYLNEVPEGRERDDLALLIEITLKQRILGVKDKSGCYVTPAFPKLIYVLQEDNLEPGSKYYYLTELAARCSAKRLVPDYISEKKIKELKKGDVYPPMGCRAFLTPDRFTDAGWENKENRGNYKEGKHRYYGRFNQGAVTINLPDVALSSHKDEKNFWKILEERLELCHRAIRLRHDRLLGTPSDIASILWQDGAIARLKPGEPIDKLLYGGYSTISLGYAGLAECVYYMKDCSHTEKAGKEFGVKVMQALNDACAKWKAAENIDYSLYGTPIESTTYKFAKCLQRRFGIVKGVTDKGYITNSYHIKVTEKIDAFSKLTKEAEFQALSPGGAVSYVEVPNMQNNIPAIMALLKHMYNTILYAEINTKSDLCENCGFDGEMQIVEEGGHLIWECPKCHNRDESKMHITRRTCGYIGTQYWNQGRTQEIKDRVLHL